MVIRDLLYISRQNIMRITHTQRLPFFTFLLKYYRSIVLSSLVDRSNHTYSRYIEGRKTNKRINSFCYRVGSEWKKNSFCMAYTCRVYMYMSFCGLSNIYPGLASYVYVRLSRGCAIFSGNTMSRFWIYETFCGQKFC